MSIRKHGQATGKVTEVQPPLADPPAAPSPGGIQAVAGSHAWRAGDDHELAAENAAADQAPADDQGDA
jgi:hypothetical protein